MVTMEELLKGVTLENQPQEIQDCLKILLERINLIRTEWGHPMTVTSGLRTREDQLRIYKSKGVSEDKIPWNSKHLTGGAVDISDPDKKLQAWCAINIPYLETAQLWCEDFGSTPNWVHFQIFPPKSGKRFFVP